MISMCAISSNVKVVATQRVRSPTSRYTTPLSSHCCWNNLAHEQLFQRWESGAPERGEATLPTTPPPLVGGSARFTSLICKDLLVLRITCTVHFIYSAPHEETRIVTFWHFACNELCTHKTYHHDPQPLPVNLITITWCHVTPTSHSLLIYKHSFDMESAFPQCRARFDIFAYCAGSVEGMCWKYSLLRLHCCILGA